MWMRYTSEAEQVIASLCVMQDYGLRRRKEENRGDQNRVLAVVQQHGRI